MSDETKVVGIRPTTAVVGVGDTTKVVARGLRKLADKIENGDYGPIEYGVLALSSGGVDAGPLFFGLADMRRDSAIGILVMGAQHLANGGLETV